jgi:hypothetical protein
VLSYDFEVARSHTQLLVAARASGPPRGAHDLIIAATARATRRTVVTTDGSGFDDLPGVAVRTPGIVTDDAAALTHSTDPSDVSGMYQVDAPGRQILCPGVRFVDVNCKQNGMNYHRLTRAESTD